MLQVIEWEVPISNVFLPSVQFQSESEDEVKEYINNRITELQGAGYDLQPDGLNGLDAIALVYVDIHQDNRIIEHFITIQEYVGR